MSLILDGTNGLSDVDGSAATPAIRGSDANTGVFFGTDIVGVSTGGSERVRVDASGNVGIGTSSPSATYGRLTVAGTGITIADDGSAKLQIGRYSAGLPISFIKMGANSTGLRFTNPTDSADLMAITDAGNVGIGTNSPDTASGYIVVDVRGSTNGGFLQVGNGTVKNTMYQSSSVGFVGTQTNHALGFVTNGTERARITSAGQFVVGDTATIGLHKAFIKQAAAEACLALQITGTDFANMVTFYNSGGTVKGSISSPSSSAVAYNTSSDYRLKENIAPMAGALAKVQQLKPCTYTWKDSGQAWEGFIAHEVAEVIPNAVTGEKDAVDAEGNPQYQGIDTSFLVATLTAAIQEQQAIITALTARVEALEGAQA
jgi:hypothetical protein